MRLVLWAYLPTRCQFPSSPGGPGATRIQVVGLPISSILNSSLHPSSAPLVRAFEGVLLFQSLHVYLGLLSSFVVSGWGLLTRSCQELQTKVIKTKTKNRAQWGRSQFSRTLLPVLCVCLPTCCCALPVGKQQFQGLMIPGHLSDDTWSLGCIRNQALRAPLPGGKLGAQRLPAGGHHV